MENSRLANWLRRLISSLVMKSAPLQGLEFEDLLRVAAARQAHAKQVGGLERQRILFLGNRYSPVSTACLQTLVEMGYEVIVGVYDPLIQRGWRRLFRKRLKSRGWSFVLRRALYAVQCNTRIALRGMGVPLSGYASLPELSRARGLDTDPLHKPEWRRVCAAVTTARSGSHRCGRVQLHP